MKLAIMSDFHLGYSDDALLQAKMALEKARELGTDAVIAAGDLFDERVPKQEVIHAAIKLFSEHNRMMKERNPAALPVIAIAGTHERRTKGLVNAIEVLDAAGLLANCHNKHIVIEGNGEKVAVLGMAGVPEEYAKQIVQAAQFKPLVGADFNIFIFHQTLREVIPFNDAFMCCEDLPRGFDLYINGHIHWRRELQYGNKSVLLPGSTVITQMKKNEMEPKGFWMFDTSTKSYEFIHISSRPFYFREIELTGGSYSDIESTVKKTVEEIQVNLAPGVKPLIKIKLRGSLAKGTSSGNIETTPLEKSFENAFVYIDKEFDIAAALKEKVELIRKLREEDKTVSEFGLSLLREKLKTAGFEKGIEELYSALTEGEVDKAVALAKRTELRSNV